MLLYFCRFFLVMIAIRGLRLSPTSAYGLTDAINFFAGLGSVKRVFSRLNPRPLDN